MLQTESIPPETLQTMQLDALRRPRARGSGPSLEYMETFKNSEGKYQCINCDRSYLHFKHLKRHFMKHTGDRPHVCSICSDTFCRSDILKRHYSRCLSKFKATGKCAAVSRVPKRIPTATFYNPAASAAALAVTGPPAPFPYYNPAMTSGPAAPSTNPQQGIVQPYFQATLPPSQQQQQQSQQSYAPITGYPQFPQQYQLPQLKSMAPPPPPPQMILQSPTNHNSNNTATSPSSPTSYPVINNCGVYTTAPQKQIMTGYNSYYPLPQNNLPSPTNTHPTSPSSTPGVQNSPNSYFYPQQQPQQQCHAQGLAIYQADGKSYPMVKEEQQQQQAADQSYGNYTTTTTITPPATVSSPLTPNTETSPIDGNSPNGSNPPPYGTFYNHNNNQHDQQQHIQQASHSSPVNMDASQAMYTAASPRSESQIDSNGYRFPPISNAAY